MTLSWVIGGGGMLGSALQRVLQAAGATLFRPAAALRWSAPGPLAQQLRADMARFAAAAGQAGSWEIYWAAGAGTFRSQAEDLLPERSALQLLLELICQPSPLQQVPGRFAFMSSAGALYAGSTDEVCTEHSQVSPTTAYAREKLAQEQQICERLQAGAGTVVLLARLSTVYGPGQHAAKPQGLLSHIARAVVHNRPVQLFVPLDTVRDYIWADDAALQAVRRLRSVGPRAAPSVQIVASESPTTISEIVSVFRRVARKAPRIVVSTDPVGNAYCRRVQFRSVFSAGHAIPARTPLVVGISALLQAERLRHAAGMPARPGR